MEGLSQDISDHLGLYVLAQNPEYKYVHYQQEQIAPALEAVARGEIKRLMIWQHPGSAKSEWSTVHFVPWYLGKNPKHAVMVASYSKPLAATFGHKIKGKMESELHLSVFPQSRLSQNTHAHDFFTTQKGGAFYAVGFDGSMTGKRVNLFVMDDPIKNQEEADSESREVFLMSQYETSIKTRLQPGGKIVLSTTRWGMRDFAARILEKEGTVEQGGDWTVLKIKAEDPPGCGTYLWEEYYGKKHYEDAKRDEDAWSALWQQEPDASSSFWFKEEWLEFYDVVPPKDKFKIYAFVDPAMSKAKKSDRTSMHFWAAGSEKKLILVDWVLDRLDPGERMTELIGLCRHWEPTQLIYEELGLQSDTYYIEQKMAEEKFPESMYPIPVGRKGPRHVFSKAQRIKLIVPFFRDRRMVLPRKMERKLSNGTRMDLTHRFIQDEYKIYKGEGSVAHEDDLDNMSRILEPEVNFEFVEQQVEEEESYVSQYRPGTTWESVF
jgi:hypothetical protein